MIGTHDMVDMLREVEHTETTVPGDEDHPIVVVEPAPVDPVVQTPMLKQQPTELDKLPIDEEGYTPTSGDELSRAARLMLRTVPDEAAEWVWTKLKAIRDKVDDAMGDNALRYESRKHARRMSEALPSRAGGEGPSDDELAALEKAMGDIDVDDIPTDELPGAAAQPGRYGRGGYKGGANAVLGLSKDDEEALAVARRAFGIDSERDPADEVADEEEAEETKRGKRGYTSAGDEGMTLKDIADKMGVSVSKVKNDLYGILMVARYTEWLMAEHPDEYRDTMEEFALEYIDAMREAMEEEGGMTQDDKRFIAHLEENPLEFVESPEYSPGFRYFISAPKNGSDPEGPYRSKMKGDTRFREHIFDLFRQGKLEKADLLAAVKEQDFPDDIAKQVKASGRKGEKTDESRRRVATVVRDPIRYASLLEEPRFRSAMVELAGIYVAELRSIAAGSDIDFLDEVAIDPSRLLQNRQFKGWVLRA